MDLALPLHLAVAVTTVVKIVGLVLSVGLAVASGIMLAQQGKQDLASDDKPTTVATRGSYIPLVLGRRRIGAVFAWAGNRAVLQERGGGGGKGGAFGGGDAPTQTIYYESGWHLLCVGPAFRLHRIWQSGKVLWEGPIDQITTPSGSRIDLGLEGGFLIYWGEENQPINSLLSSPQRIGVNSRWPNVCYILWEQKRLGPAVTWPLIDYEIEVRPRLNSASSPFSAPISFSIVDPLNLTAPWYLQSTLTVGQSLSIQQVVNGAPGNAYATVPGNQEAEFPTNKTIRVSGYGGLPDGDYTVLYSSYSEGFVGFPIAGLRDWTLGPKTSRAQSNVPLPTNLYWQLPTNSQIQSPELFRYLVRGTDTGAFPTIGGLNVVTSVPLNAGTTTRLSVFFAPQSAPLQQGFPYSWRVLFNTAISGNTYALFELSYLTPENPGAVSIVSSQSVDFTSSLSRSSASVTAVAVGWFRADFELQLGADEAHPSVGQNLRVYIEVGHSNYAGTVFLNLPLLAQSSGTRVYFAESVSGLVENTGTLSPLDLGNFDGANVAHLINEVMFSPYPWGVGLDRGLYEIEGEGGLEELGSLLGPAGDAAQCHLTLPEGETFRSILAGLMQDLGFFVTWNPASGKYVFRLIREPTAIYSLSEDVVGAQLPEIEIQFKDRDVDKLIFAFPDRQRAYRDTTLVVDQDGIATFEGAPRGEIVRLYAVVDIRTATQIVERRSQEGAIQPTVVRFQAARGARTLLPGDAVQVAGLPEVMRIVGVGLDSETDRVEIQALVDVYGVETVTPTFEEDQGGLEPPPLPPPLGDLTFRPFELPRYLSEGRVQIVVPRIRVNAQAAGANVWASSDASANYLLLGFVPTYNAGGVLASELSEDSFALLETGPQVTLQGPDNAEIADLSSQEEFWRAGGQVLIIGEEICYLRGLSVVGSDVFLSGLLRGRLGTRKVAHPVGTKFFVVRSGALFPFADPVLIQAGKTVYVKTQPLTGNVVSLDDVAAESLVVVGKGFAPVEPGAPYSANMSYSWPNGGDLELKWGYRSTASPRTGAGLQLPGVATTPSAIQGTFSLNFYNSSDVLRGAIAGLTTNSRTVTAAEITAFFGSTPSSLKVDVTNLDGSLKTTGPRVTFFRTT